MTRWPNKREAWPIPPSGTAAEYRELYLKKCRECDSVREQAGAELQRTIRQRNAALDRAERAEARLGELERGIEDALTEEAEREREACAQIIDRQYWTVLSPSVQAQLATAIRARGRE